MEISLCMQQQDKWQIDIWQSSHFKKRFYANNNNNNSSSSKICARKSSFSQPMAVRTTFLSILSFSEFVLFYPLCRSPNIRACKHYMQNVFCRSGLTSWLISFSMLLTVSFFCSTVVCILPSMNFSIELLFAILCPKQCYINSVEVHIVR